MGGGSYGVVSVRGSLAVNEPRRMPLVAASVTDLVGRTTFVRRARPDSWTPTRGAVVAIQTPARTVTRPSSAVGAIGSSRMEAPTIDSTAGFYAHGNRHLGGRCPFEREQSEEKDQSAADDTKIDRGGLLSRIERCQSDVPPRSPCATGSSFARRFPPPCMQGPSSCPMPSETRSGAA